MNVTVQIDSPGKQNWIDYLYLAAIVGDYKDSNPKDPILEWDGFHFRLFLLFTTFIYF